MCQTVADGWAFYNLRCELMAGLIAIAGQTIAVCTFYVETIGTSRQIRDKEAIGSIECLNVSSCSSLLEEC